MIVVVLADWFSWIVVMLDVDLPLNFRYMIDFMASHLTGSFVGFKLILLPIRMSECDVKVTGRSIGPDSAEIIELKPIRPRS